jgi:hypothetical protein
VLSRVDGVFGHACEWLWIAAVYRPFGHVVGTRHVLCGGVACLTDYDNFGMTDDRHEG